MAIIACSECAHQVSNLAATCPNCGAPIAATIAAPVAAPVAAPTAAPEAHPKLHNKRNHFGILIALAVLCLIAATLWYVPPNQLSALLGQLSRRAEHPVPAEHSAPAERSAPAEPLSAAIRPAFAERSPRESAVGPRPLYLITAEQLFQAYSANAVATQSRIGNSLIRIAGTVAEIDEDASGHPVVRLLTTHDASAEMMLNDDQKAAAAELVKGETVDLQCDKIQRDSTQRTIATPRGSGCALVSVDAGSTQAYLAVFMPNEKGVAPVYIVGPMSKAACLSRGDSISAQLGEARRDHIISKNCAATALESVPSEGCRLSASMTALPDMPATHLWRYDCAERPAAPRRATETLTAQKKSMRGNAVADTATVTITEPAATAADSTLSETSETTLATPAGTAAPARTPVQAALPNTPQPTANARPLTARTTPTVTEKTPSSTAADVSNAATAPAPAPAATPPALALAPAAAPAPAAAQAPAPATNADVAAAPATPADLVTVKATDPSAADRIAAYCNKATASASDQATVAAGCRHEEVAAWTRLVVNNEFPMLDDVTRRKCSESPFPDSYVAKESCAKYVLHVSR
jgi:hypothetical protein